MGNQNQTLNLELQQRVNLSFFKDWVFASCDQHGRVPVVPKLGLNPIQNLSKDWVVQIENQNPHGLAALDSKGSSGRISAIAKAFRGFQNPLSAFLAYLY
jgi:hypothetical protein